MSIASPQKEDLVENLQEVFNEINIMDGHSWETSWVVFPREQHGNAEEEWWALTSFYLTAQKI